MEECMTFAQAAGFMNEQEAQDSQKMLTAIKKGVKPPACRGKDECDRYCGEASHAEECINFAEAAGFMKPEEAVMARKTGGRGPGGCKNKDECETFCNNSDNQETCFNFGRENGMIPPEELQKMEEGKQQFSESLKQAPPQVTECISGVVGVERLEKFKSGAIMPPQNIGDKIGGCFRQMMDQPRQGQPGQDQSGQFQPGPGVINPGGQMMPPPAGPGGCKTPEECRSLCESNPDACRSFKPGEGESQNRPNENEREEMMPEGQPGGLKEFMEGKERMMQKIQPMGPAQGQIRDESSGGFMEEEERMIQGDRPMMPPTQGMMPTTQSQPGQIMPGQTMPVRPEQNMMPPGGTQQFMPPPQSGQDQQSFGTSPAGGLPTGEMPSGIPQGGGMMPPPSGGMMSPGGAPPSGPAPQPLPTGGSLLDALRLFFGL